MAIMKTNYPPATAGGTDSVTQVVLTSMFLVIGVSIACSGYKSAGSQSLTNNNSQAQPSAQTNNASPQEKIPCTLTLAGAPTIHDLRLGMTPNEVLALFPGSKDDAEVNADLSRPHSPLGGSSLLIRPGKFGSKEKYAGTTQISFALLDGRVSSFTIGYNGPAYAHVDSFIAKLAGETNLPGSDQWEVYVGMDNQLKTLKCKEFEVQAFV